jgi:thiol:disulfide interchange protein DsbD
MCAFQLVTVDLLALSALLFFLAFTDIFVQKQLMGFSLMAAAVWLFGAFANQVTADSAAGLLAFLLILAVALWALGHFGGLQHGALRRNIVRASALGLTLLGAAGLLRFDKRTAEVVAVSTEVVVDGRINWVPFDPARVQRSLREGRAVFLDYTADWCAACKTNEKLFLDTAAVRDKLVEANILPMKVDMTNENTEMDAWLEKLGRSGIPAYAVYLPGDEVELLPMVITTEIVVEHLDKAQRRLALRP